MSASIDETVASGGSVERAHPPVAANVIAAMPTWLDAALDVMLRDLWTIPASSTSDDAAARFDALLGRIGRSLCRVLGLSRCSIYLTSDACTFRGLVGFSSSATLDATVRRRAVDVATDPVTAELVRTRAPVVVADARTDARPQASVVRRLSIRDLVAIPLVVGDRVIGAAYLDDEGCAHQYGPDAVAAAAELARRTSALVRQGQVLLTLRRSLDKARAEHDMLERTTRGQLSVDAVAIEGGPPSQLVAQVSQAIGRPVLLLGRDHELLHVAGADDQFGRDLRAGWRADAFGRHAATATGLGPRILPPDPGLGLTTRQLVVAIGEPTRHTGSLLALEVARRFDAADGCVLDRAAALIRLTRPPSAGGTTSDRRGRTAFGELSIADVGERVGLPAVVVWLDRHAGARTHELLGRISGPDGRTLLLPRVSGVGVVVRSADAAPVAAELRRALGAGGSSDGPRLAVVSRVAATTDAVAAACGEVDAIATMLERNRVTERVVAIDELAGSRLVLASCTLDAAASIVAETLRPIAAQAPPLSTVLLDTVRALIATGGSIREAARRLGVHENTVRYRLRRIRELTHLDPSVAGDLFQFQVAMCAWEQLGVPIDVGRP